ncbi:MAG: hypothetical protein KGZ88_22105 [Methylomicrobium sp.]|nr:hypothetical protein [Methylomicrobium sp.]
MTHSHQPESIFLTEAEYLQSELTSEVKREYIDAAILNLANAGKLW